MIPSLDNRVKTFLQYVKVWWDFGNTKEFSESSDFSNLEQLSACHLKLKKAINQHEGDTAKLKCCKLKWRQNPHHRQKQWTERTDYYLGHSNFLEPTLILKMIISVGHIGFQPMLIF